MSLYNWYFRKVDADQSNDSVAWEDAEEGSVDESEVDENQDSDSDVCVKEKREDLSYSSSSDESVGDNDVFKSAKKSPRPTFKFDDSSSDEDFKPSDRQEKFFTPTVQLKKDRGISKDNDGALFKTPMLVPRKKFGKSTSTTPNSPIVPVSRGEF